MAQSTDLPVVVYDIPVRTGRKISTATMLALVADNSNIKGVIGCSRRAGGNRGVDVEGPRRI